MRIRLSSQSCISSISDIIRHYRLISSSGKGIKYSAAGLITRLTDHHAIDWMVGLLTCRTQAYHKVQLIFFWVFWGKWQLLLFTQYHVYILYVNLTASSVTTVCKNDLHWLLILCTKFIAWNIFVQLNSVQFFSLVLKIVMTIVCEIYFV